MKAVDVIIKKRDGMELSREEIDFFINGITRGSIPDYQAAAWAMAGTSLSDTGGKLASIFIITTSPGKISSYESKYAITQRVVATSASRWVRS